MPLPLFVEGALPALLVIGLGLGLGERALASPLAAAPAGAERSKETSGETSKETAAPLGKKAAQGKVKECCGYPLSTPRGFKISFYWLAWESEYANESYDTEIYTRDGFYLGKFPRTFVYELRLEGSGILRDGRVINYDGDCNYGVGTCFKQVEIGEHPLGMGGQHRPLQPFRSVAIDPRYIPIGTPLFLPQLVGMHLPDGTRHDGCVRADDTGGGIRRREIDFFVESYANYKFLADNLWWDMGVTPLVEEPRCAYLRRGDPGQERQNEHTDWLALHTRPQPVAARANTKGGVKGAVAGARRPTLAKNLRPADKTKGKSKDRDKDAALVLARKDRPGYKGERVRDPSPARKGPRQL